MSHGSKAVFEEQCLAGRLTGQKPKQAVTDVAPGYRIQRLPIGRRPRWRVLMDACCTPAAMMTSCPCFARRVKSIS